MNERDRRAADRLRVEQTTVRDAAGVIRSAPELHTWAGLDRAELADPLAALLELLAGNLAAMDPHTRDHIVNVAYDCVGQPMQQARIRRSRRR
ncbi:hypothetical protein [Pseudonocardia sp. McavD-2-B]|uniref:hypothetical protein n=1 Tax=Pseudonocardia sp. McavD-2-B TaxID=2954499 RepID=UPI002096820C|nr:hypothetical protein [Pseudonocardia sp. McavD-2-B]MCO7196631.1 hypothetical protein [Pseudonocardia sp. McavD-2-B]